MMSNYFKSPLTLVSYAAAFTLMSLLAGQAEPQNRGRNTAILAEFNDSLRGLATQLSPSVVQIVGFGYGLEADEQRKGASVLSTQSNTGSGMIVSADGYIMTNAHVVEGARMIRVRLNTKPNGQPPLFEAKVVGMDREVDLALLKIEATDLVPLTFANSLDIKQGQLAFAFGSPLGMENSVSMGIVSAPSRQLNNDDPKVYVQTDAPINPGNSGGPLVDIEGHVVGMNTFILTQSGGSEGMGFAIPSNVIRYAYASFRKDGHVHRGEIGINARTITAFLGSAFNVEPERGVLVEDVQPDGPADAAGVEVGDVVLSFGARQLHNVRDLYLELFEYSLGDSVELSILRRGENLKLSLAVTESKNDPKRFADMVSPDKNLVSRLAILGITIDDDIANKLSLRFRDGVLVVALAGSSGYFGDQPEEGDVIHEVNGRRVTSLETLRTALSTAKAGLPLVLQAERAGRLKFLILESSS